MKLTKKQIEHIATLARLGLDEKEIKKFRKELSSIFDWVEELSEVDTKKVEPMGQVTGLYNVMREDTVKCQMSNVKCQMLDNAPMREGGYIRTKTPF